MLVYVPDKNVNDKNVKPKMQIYIEAAERQGSENWGDVKTGPITRFDAAQIKNNLSDKSRIRGVFTKKEQVIGFLKEVKAADLDQSCVITGVLSEVIPCCHEAGVIPHSINFSLGVWGNTGILPDEDTLSITTMCGHHMIPPKFVKYIIEQVEKGKMTAEEGANKLSNFCYCGFSIKFAAQILFGTFVRRMQISPERCDDFASGGARISV